MFWTEREGEVMTPADVVTTAPGFPSRDEVTRHYEKASGFDLESLAYFIAFTYWKMACLSQGAVHRSLNGSAGGLQRDRTYDQRRSQQRVEDLFLEAEQAARRAGI
jgi:aminoglycoside phosphotransferase (APT) family kinase protein